MPFFFLLEAQYEGSSEALNDHEELLLFTLAFDESAETDRRREACN